jgi:hypothetical protein
VPSREENLSDLVLLDKDGDAILAIDDPNSLGTIKFLISTKVLCLVSPVFAPMFGPDFEEGQTIRQGGLILVRLGDDNASAMKAILKALHYHCTGEFDPVDAEELASIAVHCDKYNCRAALRPWIFCWFNNLERLTRSSEELAFSYLQPTSSMIPGTLQTYPQWH